MTIIWLKRASALVILFMLAVSAWVWPQLPADSQIAVHWGLDGQPDRFQSKEIGLLLVPGIALLAALFMGYLPWLEPRRRNLERSPKLYHASWGVMLMVLGFIHVMILGEALGYAVPLFAGTAIIVALALIMIGNFLGKSRSMFLIGFRTPWTLSSETVWRRINRLAGKLLVATGVVSIIIIVFSGAPDGLLAMVTGAAITALWAVLYSFILWRREEDQREPE